MLKVREITAGYQQGSRVLDEFSMEIRAGEVIALIGRNGMGKSTFLKALTGHVPISSGQIEFTGKPITNSQPHEIARAGIGYVPQGREIFSDLSVEENLLLGTLGKPDVANVIADWVYEMFPILAERRKQRAGTLSGGQQQQLAISRALLGEPVLLLLDEPSEGIQPSIVHEIGQSLRRLAEIRNLSILLVEQNLELVKSLARRCLFMENGKIAHETNDPSELSTESKIVQKYLSV